MNVALCYSGQLRDFKKCFESHVKHIIEPNKDCNFFIFLHSWADKDLEGESYFKDRMGRDRGFYKTDNVSEVLHVNPDSLLIEKPMNFQTDLVPDPRFPHPMQNVLSMYYSIMMSNEIKRIFCSIRGINIDWSLRMRTDLFFQKDLKLSDYDNKLMYINNQRIHTEYAVNDLFSFSSDDNMNHYSQTFNRIPEMASNGCAVNPECFLGFNLKNCDMEIKKENLQRNIYNLLRDI
ncbi:MAG: hypothetical protein HWN81_02050 [Candidatus Lokiarchaeota archaeon]|nr:hypothetical protein [Candidatus Lokiarchaeota archaeon]